MKKKLVFVWEQIGPYHIDRCEAVAEAFAEKYEVVGIELAETTSAHVWDHPEPPTSFRLVTLFKGSVSEQSWYRLFRDLLRQMFRERPTACFLCHYDRIEILLIALVLRLFGCSVYTMIESKFDDKPRRLWREVLKSAFLVPYRGALVGGSRSRAYMEFLGFDQSRIATGYDTVSTKRIQALARGHEPAANFAEKPFVIIARMVEKKNLSMALDAYQRYRALAGLSARELILCGDGVLRADLEQQVAAQGIEGVVFRGVVQPADLPGILKDAAALILPSVEEQWGLVANEAVALGVPLLLSINCGARDSLLRTAVNGYVFEPDNPSGLAHLMQWLGAAEIRWASLSGASLSLRELADSANFARGVGALLAFG